jgi:hypothetical protein
MINQREKNIFMSSVMKLCNINVDVWRDKRDIDNDTFSGFRRDTRSSQSHQKWLPITMWPTDIITPEMVAEKDVGHWGCYTRSDIFVVGGACSTEGAIRCCTPYSNLNFN